MSLNMAQLLRGGANAFMATVIAKRVAGDVVRSVPYLSVGVGAVLGVVSGVLIGRARNRRRTQPFTRRLAS